YLGKVIGVFLEGDGNPTQQCCTLSRTPLCPVPTQRGVGGIDRPVDIRDSAESRSSPSSARCRVNRFVHLAVKWSDPLATDPEFILKEKVAHYSFLRLLDLSFLTDTKCR